MDEVDGASAAPAAAVPVSALPEDGKASFTFCKAFSA